MKKPKRIWINPTALEVYKYSVIRRSRDSPSDVEYVCASALSSRDIEIREVLEGLAIHQIGSRRPCWCPLDYESEPHSPACLAARGLWNAVIGKGHEDGDTRPTP